MKTLDLLQQEHRLLGNALDVLLEMAFRAESGQNNDPGDLEDLLEFLRGFGDWFHQGKEECVLFPALLTDRGQKHYAELCSLIFEHNRQRFLLDGLCECQSSKNARDFSLHARRLHEVLLAHIREEEEVLFPLVGIALSATEDERVFSEMLAFDKAWQDRELRGLLQRLARLESKYRQAREGCPPSDVVV